MSIRRDATEPPARSFDVVTAVWGADHRQPFLDVCVPNQLTPGNLGALPEGSRYRVFTSREDVDFLESSSTLQRVNEQIPVDIVVMPELSAPSRNRFNRITACHRRALTDARESRSALIFLMADYFMSEGTFAAAVRRHGAGSRAVVCSGIRVNREAFIAALHARGGVRGVPHRELVSLALDHLHPFTRAHMIDSERTAQCPIGVYWNVPGEGILARCFYLHPLMVDPLRRDVLPDETIDGNYIKRACPVREQIHVISDSDELVIFEMSHIDAAFVGTCSGGVSLWRAASMISRCNPHQQSYWAQPIRLHARDIGEAWSGVESRSARFADRATRLGITRRLLTVRRLKRLAHLDVVFGKRLRRAAKPLSVQLRRSAVLLTNSAARAVQRLRLRKRLARVARRARRRARRSVALLTRW